MANIIKDDELKRVASNVKPDAKRRVVLPGSLVREDVIYHIYSNRLGQIVLDPQVIIPASEAWLYRNHVALALVEKGLAEAAEGKVIKGKRSDL